MTLPLPRANGSPAQDTITLRANQLSDRFPTTDLERWQTAQKMLTAVGPSLLEGETSARHVENVAAWLLLWVEAIQAREVVQIHSGEAA